MHISSCGCEPDCGRHSSRRWILKGGNLPGIEQCLRIELSEQLDQLRHHSCPSGLVARAEPRPVVAVKILIEEDQIAPLGIGLELLGSSVHRPATAVVAQEDPRQAIRNLFGDFEQVHHLSGPGRALDRERVAVVRVEVQQGPDQHHVDRHPDRAAPVRVAAEHSAVGFGRQVVDAVLLAVNAEDVRMVFVELGQRANAVRAQKLVLVEHLRQNSAETFRIDQRQNGPPGHSIVIWSDRMHRRSTVRASGAAAPGCRSRFSARVHAAPARSPWWRTAGGGRPSSAP